ncbi:hypothetical protein AX16_001344 [Volvariella volvacea WC 439]|nr:hypothetical protein AX16_001344 [Volvariella volvacea WC 439]
MSSSEFLSSTLLPTATESASSDPDDGEDVAVVGWVYLGVFGPIIAAMVISAIWSPCLQLCRSRKPQALQSAVPMDSTTTLGPDLEQAREDDIAEKEKVDYPTDLRMPVPMVRRPSSMICAGDVGSRRETSVRRNVSQ